MISIPIDVLRAILDHCDNASLAAISLLNKICCSYSQDILYRDIHVQNSTQFKVCQTLGSAGSAHLAKRVRSFFTHLFGDPEDISGALRNMSSLRELALFVRSENSFVLDECTRCSSFKLDTFTSDFTYDPSLRDFLINQPTLTTVKFWSDLKHPHQPQQHQQHPIPVDLDPTCLPNLTRVVSTVSWIPHLIDARPVTEVIVLGSSLEASSLSCLPLSAAPIKKLTIDSSYIYNMRNEQPLGQILPALTHLTIATDIDKPLEIFYNVCIHYTVSIYIY
jgi:hypothetical protein